METPKKEGQKLPLLTPKKPDGSQRVIKQIMVIDPNKLRVAGLDLKMAEALKKSKGRTANVSPAAQSKEDKLALTKSILNRKLKQAQRAKESVRNVQLPVVKSVEETLRKLTYSNLIRVPDPKPKIKVTDLKSLMPPPSSPAVASKSQTVVINFLKHDQKTGVIDVDFASSEHQVKIEADSIPKASIQKPTGVRKKDTLPRVIESKVLSPDVKFEMKKRPQVTEIEVTFSQLSQIKVEEDKVLPPVRRETAIVKPTVEKIPMVESPRLKNLPKVLESKVLSPEEKIDLRTLGVTSPEQVVFTVVPLTTSNPGIALDTSQNETPTLKKEGDRKSVLSKPQAEESAVDFIKSLFEAKLQNKSMPKAAPKKYKKAMEEDATSFLMSLFGQQAAKPPNKADVSPAVKPAKRNSVQSAGAAIPQLSSVQRLGKPVQSPKPIKIEGEDVRAVASVYAESAHERVNLTNEKSIPFQETIPYSSVTLDSVYSVSLQPSTEIDIRSQKVDTEGSMPTVSASSETEQTYFIVEAVSPKEEVVVTTIHKSVDSTCITPTESLPTLTKDVKAPETKQSNVPNPIPADDSSKTFKVGPNSNLTHLSPKTDEESPAKHNLKDDKEPSCSQAETEQVTKLDQKAPTNKITAPPSDSSKESALKKEEPKVEAGPPSTGPARRKKSVPVLIAKLNRSRKPIVSQEKLTEKVKQTDKVSDEVSASKESQSQLQETISKSPAKESQPIESTERLRASEKSPGKRKDTFTERDKENPATGDETLVEAKSSETEHPIRKSESQVVLDNKREEMNMVSLEQVQVPTTTPESRRRSQRSTTPKGNQDLKSITKSTKPEGTQDQGKQKQPKSIEVQRVNQEGKSETTEEEGNIRESQGQIEEENKQVQQDKPLKGIMTPKVRTSRSTSPKIPKPYSEKLLDPIPTAREDETEGQGKEIESQPATIAKEKKIVESRKAETPMNSKRKGRHSAIPKDSENLENTENRNLDVSVAKPVDTTAAKGSQSTAELKPVPAQEQDTEGHRQVITIPNLEEESPEVPSSSKGNKKKEYSAAAEGSEKAPTKSLETLNTSQSNANISESQSLETQELSQIQADDKQALTQDQGNTTNLVTKTICEKPLIIPEPKKAPTVVKPRGRRSNASKNQNITEQSVTSSKYNETKLPALVTPLLDVDICNELSLATSIDMHSSPSKTISENAADIAKPPSSKEMIGPAPSTSKARRSTKKENAGEAVGTEVISTDIASGLPSSKTPAETTPALETETSKGNEHHTPSTSKTRRSTNKKKADEVVSTEVVSADIASGSPSSKTTAETTQALDLVNFIFGTETSKGDEHHTPSTSKTRRSTNKKKADEVVSTEVVSADIASGSPSSKTTAETTRALDLVNFIFGTETSKGDEHHTPSTSKTRRSTNKKKADEVVSTEVVSADIASGSPSSKTTAETTRALDLVNFIFGTETSKGDEHHTPSTSKTRRSTNKKKTDEVVSTELVSADIASSLPCSKTHAETTPALNVEGDNHHTPSTSKTRRSTNKKKTDEVVSTEVVSADTPFDLESAFSKADEITPCDQVTSPSKKRQSTKNKKGDEARATEVMSPNVASDAKKGKISASNDSLQEVPDTITTDSLSDVAISEARTPRSRKKTLKFEEYSSGSGKTLTKTPIKDPEPLTIGKALATFPEPTQAEYLTSGNQLKRTPRLVKGKINLVTRKKPSTKKDDSLINNPPSELPEKINVTSSSEHIPSPTRASWKIVDDVDGWQDGDSDSELIDAVTAIEEKEKSQLHMKPSLSVDKPTNQGKPKNPFRKTKPNEKEETEGDSIVQAKSNEETDFFGFNEREIEEGHQSTSLRLSESEDVVPLQHLLSPESCNKKKDSPGVKKTPLSAGKKQKAEQQNWTKTAAASLKSWLKPSANITEAEGSVKKVHPNEMKSSIAPKKRQVEERNSSEPTKLDEEVNPLQGDLRTTNKLLEEQREKPRIEEVLPEIDVVHDEPIEHSPCEGKTKRKTYSRGKKSTNMNDDAKQEEEVNSPKSDLKTAKKTKERKVSELEVEESPPDSEKRGKKKPKKGEVKSDLEQDLSSKKALNKKRKALTVEKDTPEIKDEGGSFERSLDLCQKVSRKPQKLKLDKNASPLEDKVSSVQEEMKSNQKKSAKKKAAAHDIDASVSALKKPSDEFNTPSKPAGRKRKRSALEETKPEIKEHPPKICRLEPESEIDLLLTPRVKRRGRPAANPENSPKPAYVPIVPVNPLERKYKNDTEFNPRLLIIRQKEELKTDEPITDPGLQMIPKNKDDVQCALCMGYTQKKKWIQHTSGHYGIGWIVGTPPPLNVKSRASILNYMVEFFKLTKVKGLNCRLCQAQRRSALGLLVHLEQCCLTEDELKQSRVQCEHCKNDYSKSSIVIHLRACPVQMENARLARAQAEETPTDASVKEEEVLSNTGRLKRKSVIKAENKFKNLDDIEFLPDELIKHIPQQPIGNRTSNWLREIQSFGKGFCVQKKCSFTATTVEELEQHCQDDVCLFNTKPGYLCTKCKFHDETIETVRSHVIEQHKPRSLKEFDDSGDEAELGSESSSESGSSGDEEYDNEQEDGNEEQKPKKVKRIRNRKRNQQKDAPTKDFKKLLPERQCNIAQSVAKWYDKFIKNHYSKDPLFTFATPSAVQGDDDGYESYFPKSAISMKFILRGFKGFVKEYGKSHVQPDQWQHLERLKGVGMRHEHAMYVGGPVKSIAWVPLEPEPASSIQYLATATRKGIDKFTRYVQPKLSRSLVFIQKYDISDSSELRGEIHYAFPIDAGPIHCIEFLPSGGYAPEMNRLGLLAVATVETEIKIYSLPLEVEKKNCDIFPIVRLEPSFLLCLELPDSPNEYSDEYQSQCISVVWSQTAGHNYIIGGYLNGYVAIWDISDDDDNLNRFVDNGTKKFVPVSYFWSMDNRIRQIAVHYDMHGLRWLAVGNATRKILLYDLREISKPVLFCVDTTKNVCNSMDWPVVWENISYALGDAMPSHGNCINTVSPMNLVFIHRRFDKFCCGVNDLHFNAWTNMYAAAADNGDIHITILREGVLDVGLRMKNDVKVISTLDIVPLDGNEIGEKTSQTPGDGWRLFETDYKEKYGLVFSSAEKITAARKPDFYGAKRIPALNMRRLMRVNRLRFNPNRNANSLLAVGYDNGLVRVLHNDWLKKYLKDSETKK